MDYIFVQLGGNQLMLATKQSVYKQVLALILAIRQVNPQTRFFIVGVLLRPIDNQHVKSYVMNYNRFLKNAAERIDHLFGKTKFLAIQLSFIGTDGPKIQYFNQDDGLTLNQVGATFFRKTLFKLAGFVQNAQ